MTDLATLVLAVDSTQVKKGTVALDDLAAAGKRSEQVVKRMSAEQFRAVQGIDAFARSTGKLTAQSNTAAAAASRMIRNTTGIGASAGLARHHLQNLTFQVNDVAMALATGQNPMRVFIQQGSQIAQIGQQAGVGLGGMVKAVLRMVAPFSALIGAAGLLALAFGRVKDEANDANLDAFIQSLGLTKKEMEELTDTTVTWGDVAGATFDVIAERGGSSSKEITDAFGQAFETIAEFGQFSVGVLLGAFGALVKGVISVAQNVALGLAKGIGFGINRVIEQIEALINKAIDGINAFAGIMKSLGIDVGSLGKVSLGRIEVGGSFSNPLADMKNQFFSTFGDVQSGFGAIGARADQRRRNRLEGQARDIIGDRDGGGKSKGGRAGAHRDVADALDKEAAAFKKAEDAAQSYLAGLQGETARIGKTAEEIKMMEVATAAAKAPTAALAQAIRDAGQAWLDATKAQQSADFIKNVIEPLEFENSLIDLNIDAQKKLRAERELTAAGVERGSEVWERYLAAITAATAAETKKAANDNKSPWEQWAEQFTPDKMIEDFQRIQIQGLEGLAAGLTEVIMGTKSLGDVFADIAQQIIGDIIQMTIRMLIFKAISAAFNNPFGGGGSFDIPFAKGGVFGGGMDESGAFALGGLFRSGNVVPFASGGIVGGPMMFPMSGGRTGLMGEAGPEAIMPLARDGQGRLGVRGGEPQRIIVQIDMDNDMLQGKIVQTSNAVVEFKRRGIVQEAQGATARSFSRPKLMGR